MGDCTECLEFLDCPPCPEQSIFSILNICRIIFYTPIIFLGGLVTSVAYDYVTFKEDKVEEKKSD